MAYSTDRRLGLDLAEAVRTAARDAGWSQLELARRLDTTQATIWRLQSGRSRYVDIDLASRALDVLGIRVTFDGATLGWAGRREQRDAVHARCAGYLARRLQGAGWDVKLEVEIGEGRFRGWIDLLAFRELDESSLVVEIKTELRNLGSIQRTVGWYTRESRSAARRFGWRPSTVVPALVLLESEENDVATAVLRAALKESFEGDAQALAAWIVDPAEARPRAAIGMIDPRSRRRSWLVRTRSDGRRSKASYLDYGDAAAQLRGKRRSRAVGQLTTRAAR